MALITLSAPGSDGVKVEADASDAAETIGGMTLRIAHPVAGNRLDAFRYAFTREQAQQLARDIAQVLGDVA